MKKVVFDVPAEYGGALTILNQYYEKAVNDVENEWLFVISTPNLPETDNVKVIKYPWVKKSWFHRLFFDQFLAHKIVEENKADEVISLQNIIVRNVSVKQTLYLHQPLPFVEKRYRINENFKFWIYQNLISKMIFSSIKKADKVIVQTQWMKKAVVEKSGVSINKIEIVPPKVEVDANGYFKNNESNIFFYPASGLLYKNHSIIVETCKLLNKKDIHNYKVVFTLTGKENKNIIAMYEECNKNKLPVEFVGSLSRTQVYEYYCKSTLLFPSYIETFGLPLVEAKVHKCPIIASDCAFSHEILKDYTQVDFFDPFNKDELLQIMSSRVGDS